MSKTRFNQLFATMMILGVLGSLFISPAVTGRAKGKEEILLLPVIRPVRIIAAMFHSKYARKELPPGETTVRKDPELAAENSELRQQIVFLNRQLEDLQLVESERKHLGNFSIISSPSGWLQATPRRGANRSASCPPQRWTFPPARR